MSKVYIGIDNGVTGTIGFTGSVVACIATPIKKEQSYTKSKNLISRVDSVELCRQLLLKLRVHPNRTHLVDCVAVIERPMINPGRWKATLSAIRALEATLVVLERLQIAHMYIDSREWQKALLPSGCEKEELKKASMDIGCRLFPALTPIIQKHKDADGLLISEYARRKGL